MGTGGAARDGGRPMAAAGGPGGRSTAYVVVDGIGPLPLAVTEHLRVAGVGRVDAGGYAVDAALSGPGLLAPSVVVLVAAAPVSAHGTTSLRTRGIVHLPVWAREERAVVGPLVRPGASACLQCLDHARADRDPAWALLGPRIDDGVIGPPRRVSGDPALLALVASTTSMVVLAEVDGRCPSGVSLEVSLPWPRVVQRRWEPHPWCSCGAAAGCDAQWTA